MLLVVETLFVLDTQTILVWDTELIELPVSEKTQFTEHTVCFVLSNHT